METATLEKLFDRLFQKLESRLPDKEELKPLAFYTYQEVAELLSIHIQTVKNAVRAEKLFPRYIGSEPRIEGREILRWLEDGGKTGMSAANSFTKKCA